MPDIYPRLYEPPTPPVAVRSWRVDGNRLLAVCWRADPPADAQLVAPGLWLALRWADPDDNVSRQPEVAPCPKSSR